jgi:hypothetical protein
MKILYIIESYLLGIATEDRYSTEETATDEIYESLAAEGFNVTANHPKAFKDNIYYKITIEEVEGKKD